MGVLKSSEQKRIRKFTMRQVSVVFSNRGVQSKRKCESHEFCVCIVGFSACGYQKKRVVYETECSHLAVQRGKQDQKHLQH